MSEYSNLINYWIEHIDKLKAVPPSVKKQVKDELTLARFTGKVSKDLVKKLEKIADDLNDKFKID